MRQINFRGWSGQAYEFKRVDPNSAWAAGPGIAIFAARGAYGWRVVRISCLQGRLHDVQPIWVFAEAQRCGARAVFVLNEACRDRRQGIFADLESGLNPVFVEPKREHRLAA